MNSKNILPPSYLYASLLLMALLHFLLPLARLIAWPWTLFGAMPLALGIYLNLAADAALKQHHTTVKPFAESAALVTTGVYHLSRHPMYLGMVLILLGIAIFMGTAFPLLIAIVFGVVMEFRFVRMEERMLQTRFGAAWRLYQAQVRRWI